MTTFYFAKNDHRWVTFISLKTIVGARWRGQRHQGPSPRRRTSAVLLAKFRAPGRACGKLDRARSRLYRKENLQVNMRLKALAEIFQTHIYLQNLRTRSFFPFSNKILLPTSIYLQNSALIIPRTSLSKFRGTWYGVSTPPPPPSGVNRSNKYRSGLRTRMNTIEQY